VDSSEKKTILQNALFYNFACFINTLLNIIQKFAYENEQEEDAKENSFRPNIQ
jgi:hypothetical protein